MEYIGEVLNKIRFDTTVKPEEYTIVYFDRMAEKTEEVKFISIGRKGNFITVLKDGKVITASNIFSILEVTPLNFMIKNEENKAKEKLIKHY